MSEDGEVKPGREVRMSEEVFAKLAPVAQALGVDLGVQGEVSPSRPVSLVVMINKDILASAVEIAQIVRTEGLYLLNGSPVTIELDGTVEPMDAERFVSWLPRFAVVAKGKDEEGKPVKGDLPAKRASLLLKSDLLKAMLPEVTRILPSRVPVYADGGKGVRLLPLGYDAEHKVFVTSDAPKMEEWELERAVNYLRSLFVSFPWGDAGRSLAAQVASMVGMFVQLLFPDGCPVPLFFWNANLEGSGKSILAECGITPIYGSCRTDDYGQGEEFLKVLASRAEAYSSYLFLDDVEGFIKSQTLNRWVVTPRWSSRRMHSTRMIEVPKKCMTLITANQATLSNDLVRRAVMIDLFSEKSAAERLKEREERGEKVVEVTGEWLARPENRKAVLSALWAMVRHWSGAGMPAGPRCIASFVEWTRVVGGIVHAAGFGDAFEPAKLADAGDKWQTEFLTMFAGVVRKFDLGNPEVGARSIALAEWCAVAREKGLYLDKLGELEMTRQMMDESPRLWKLPAGMEALTEEERAYQAARYMHPQKQASPWAKILRKKAGQTFEVDGRRYRFADRNTNTSVFAVYPV